MQAAQRAAFPMLGFTRMRCSTGARATHDPDATKAAPSPRPRAQPQLQTRPEPEPHRSTYKATAKATHALKPRAQPKPCTQSKPRMQPKPRTQPKPRMQPRAHPATHAG
eukprot:3637933-Pyramimonas_sp.AAC.1